MISGSETVLAGKWGGLFLGYLLRKKFIGSRGEAPPCMAADDPEGLEPASGVAYRPDVGA